MWMTAARRRPLARPVESGAVSRSPAGGPALHASREQRSAAALSEIRPEGAVALPRYFSAGDQLGVIAMTGIGLVVFCW